MSIGVDWRVNRRDFLHTTALAALALGVATPSAAAEHDPATRPATHNMLMVGEQTVFFSHLPMFGSLSADGTKFLTPHRFQVILQAAFTPEQMASYVKDRQANPGTQFYTIGPEKFLLRSVFEPKTRPELTEFMADVFNGHLEHDDNHLVPGLEGAKIKIARVVHGREFDPRASKPTTLEYLLFGRGPERFLAHAIFAPPDFDHVLVVKSVSANLTDSDLEHDVRVLIPGRSNTAKDRLREGQRVEAMLQIGSAAPSKVQLEVGRRIYFVERELLMPPVDDPTDEEKKDS
jgi:hypothetical protein